MLGGQSQFQQNLTDLFVRYLLSLYSYVMTHTTLQERLFSHKLGRPCQLAFCVLNWNGPRLSRKKRLSTPKDSGISAQQGQDPSPDLEPEGKKLKKKLSIRVIESN